MQEACSSESSMQTSLRQKQPLRRLQNALNSCINVAIPLHIELLNKHKSNIEKFTELEEWNKVHKEQVNASRTVEQLKADIWSLDLLRSQVDDVNLQEFDRLIKKPQELVTVTLQQFLSDESIHQRKAQETVCQDEKPEKCNPMLLEQGVEAILLQRETEKLLLQDLAQARQTENSWNGLVKDCKELNDSMILLSSYVHQQEEPLNSIEANIDAAKDNVAQGSTFLSKAVKYKAAIYPLSGALIGSCIGGPVGLVVGLKAGAVAGALGGLLGFQSGRFFKKKAQKSVDMEMYKLEQQKCLAECSQRCSSMPDLQCTEIENGIVSVEKVLH